MQTVDKYYYYEQILCFARQSLWRASSHSVLCKTVLLTRHNALYKWYIYTRAYLVLCNTGIGILIINCLTFIGSRLKRKKERKKELFILRISAYISLSFSRTHKYYYFCKLTKQTTRDFGKLASFFISDINIIQFF